MYYLIFYVSLQSISNTVSSNTLNLKFVYYLIFYVSLQSISNTVSSNTLNLLTLNL